MPTAFFGASFLTSGLKSLLEDVLGRLTRDRRESCPQAPDTVRRGQVPYTWPPSCTPRVRAQHSMHCRKRRGFQNPRECAWPWWTGNSSTRPTASDPQAGRRLGEGRIWGWVAWSLGGREGYDLVRAQDEARVAPGGDALVELLKGGPSLILLDELLQYLISAGGIRIEQTTLRDETLSFLQRLTAAVGSVDNAVLVSCASVQQARIA